MITVLHTFYSKHHMFIRAAVAFFLCAAFFSFYTTNLFGHISRTKRMSYAGKTSYTEETVHSNKGENSNILNCQGQAMMETEENVHSRMLINIHSKAISNRLLFSFSYLFILLSFCLFDQYFKEWLTHVAQWEQSRLLVDYIERKDGKKGRLSLKYSF